VLCGKASGTVGGTVLVNGITMPMVRYNKRRPHFRLTDMKTHPLNGWMDDGCITPGNGLKARSKGSPLTRILSWVKDKRSTL
jgi:hypothetical protein